MRMGVLSPACRMRWIQCGSAPCVVLTSRRAHMGTACTTGTPLAICCGAATWNWNVCPGPHPGGTCTFIGIPSGPVMVMVAPGPAPGGTCAVITIMPGCGCGCAIIPDCIIGCCITGACIIGGPTADACGTCCPKPCGPSIVSD